MVIRAATPSDVDQLIPLRRAFTLESRAGQPLPANFDDLTRGYLEKHLPGSDFVCFIVESEGKIVATSAVNFHHRLPNIANPHGTEGYISNCYTLPSHRRQGLAASLLARIITLARERCIGRLTLYAMPDAQSIYQRAGFTLRDNHAPEMRLTTTP